MRWWKWINRRVAGLQSALSLGERAVGLPDEVGGRSLEQWEQGWRRIGLLGSAHVTAPKHSVGLYRLRQGTTIVHLGSAGGCLRQALRALLHDPDPHVQVLPEPLRDCAHELAVEVLITESGALAHELERCWQVQAKPSRPAPVVPASAESLPPNSSVAATTSPTP